MNIGPTKGCGRETFAALKSVPSLQAMYQVHRNIRTGPQGNAPDEQIANRDEKCAAGYIKLSVAPDGDSAPLERRTRARRRASSSRSWTAICS